MLTVWFTVGKDVRRLQVECLRHGFRYFHGLRISTNCTNILLLSSEQHDFLSQTRPGLTVQQMINLLSSDNRVTYYSEIGYDCGEENSNCSKYFLAIIKTFFLVKMYISFQNM